MTSKARSDRPELWVNLNTNPETLSTAFLESMFGGGMLPYLPQVHRNFNSKERYVQEKGLHRDSNNRSA